MNIRSLEAVLTTLDFGSSGIREIFNGHKAYEGKNNADGIPKSYTMKNPNKFV